MFTSATHARVACVPSEQFAADDGQSHEDPEGHRHDDRGNDCLEQREAAVDRHELGNECDAEAGETDAKADERPEEQAGHG